MTPPSPSSAGGPRSRPARGTGRVVLPLVPSLERSPARRRPLPDAAALGLLLVPDSAPPYDESPAAAGGQRRERGAQASEPTALRQPAVPRQETAARSQRATPSPQRATPSPQRATPSPQRATPSPQRATPPSQAAAPPSQAAAACWPSQFAQVLAETLAGSRPPAQITPWTTDQARRLIRRLGPMLAAGTTPRVRRIVTSRPSPEVVEMTVIVGCGPAVRALAVRLERDGPHDRSPGRAARAARWVCTDVEAA
jgi:hypothetical protein